MTARSVSDSASMAQSSRVLSSGDADSISGNPNDTPTMSFFSEGWSADLDSLIETWCSCCGGDRVHVGNWFWVSKNMTLLRLDGGEQVLLS